MTTESQSDNTNRGFDAGLSEYLHLLSSLVREPSVVGVEQAFFRVVLRELEELSVNISLYHGVLVASGRQPNSIIFSAHVDRHGLLCTGPNEFQYAAFIAGNRGELNGDSVSEQMMELIQDRFIGQRVQSHLPHVGTYLGQGAITRSFVCPYRRNLIFEIDGLSHLQPGTPVSFVDRLSINDGFISAQLDNVVSVALLIHLFRCGFQGTALFTAGEEAGRSWRHALEWFVRQQLWTDRLIVLDTSPYPTPLAAAAQEVVLRRRDATANFSSAMTNELRDRCDSLGIAYSFKDDFVEAVNRTREKPLSFGRTELGRLVAATDGKINGTTLQIPTTSYHTATETASMESVRAVIRLMASYIR